LFARKKLKRVPNLTAIALSVLILATACSDQASESKPDLKPDDQAYVETLPKLYCVYASGKPCAMSALNEVAELPVEIGLDLDRTEYLSSPEAHGRDSAMKGIAFRVRKEGVDLEQPFVAVNYYTQTGSFVGRFRDLRYKRKIVPFVRLTGVSLMLNKADLLPTFGPTHKTLLKPEGTAPGGLPWDHAELTVPIYPSASAFFIQMDHPGYFDEVRGKDQALASGGYYMLQEPLFGLSKLKRGRIGAPALSGKILVYFFTHAGGYEAMPGLLEDVRQKFETDHAILKLEFFGRAVADVKIAMRDGTYRDMFQKPHWADGSIIFSFQSEESQVNEASDIWLQEIVADPAMQELVQATDNEVIMLK